MAISWRGDVVFNEAYGYADLRGPVALTPAHIFRVASHSKTFIATALMQLAERGRLRLDDPAAAFLPWLSEHHDRRIEEITLRQLLSHGAGVTRDGRDCDFWQLRRPFPDAGQLRDEVLAAPLVTEPNLALKYSNIGYSLLGMVIEKASGLDYHDYVLEHIVGPLGLTSTGPEWKKPGPPFIPHTNFDLVAAMVFLDDTDESNGCLRVIPGSHTLGPLEHDFSADGQAYGTEVKDKSVFADESRWVSLVVPAGSIALHHSCTLHSSGANHSDRPRSSLIFEYRATDARQIAGATDPIGWGTQVRGTETGTVRMVEGTFHVPGKVHWIGVNTA